MVWLTAEGGGDDEKDDMMRRLVWNVMPGHLLKPKSTLALITEPPDYVCSRFLLCASLTALESSAQTDGDLLREAIKSTRLLFDSLSFGKKKSLLPAKAV